MGRSPRLHQPVSDLRHCSRDSEDFHRTFHRCFGIWRTSDPPLGLATLAAYLNDDDLVEIQDEHVEPLDLEATPEQRGRDPSPARPRRDDQRQIRIRVDGAASSIAGGRLPVARRPTAN